MTKPPEGGLSPQEHLAKPDGQGVSRIASVPKTPDGNDFVPIALGASGCFFQSVRIAMNVSERLRLYSQFGSCSTKLLFRHKCNRMMLLVALRVST
jgi:hypothetical protein